MANMFKSVLASARAILQRKTVTPTTSVQTITPDSGYDGLEQVTIEAVNLQSKTTTMTPPSPSSWSATTTKLGTVTPDSGYDGLSQVDISIPMVPDNTTLTLQSSGSDYDTYKPSRAGYVYTSSYLRVPKSGGETTLWTNSSPTSAVGNTQITSINIDSYTYVKITFRFSASNSDENSYIFKVSEFKNKTSTNQYAYGVGTFVGGEGARSRRFYYISGGGIGFTAGTSISSQNNNVFIPIKIVGIN